jgi:DNA-binding CsgD family transcriptional regulator
MFRQAVLYGLALAALALLLDWLDYSHAMRLHSTEFYVVCVAVLFVALGIWVGHRLTPSPRSAVFAPNTAALASLGISAREAEVLTLIAAGNSNKVIARHLAISPNTVKTHVSHVFEKLEVASRTQAIDRARSLDILP